MFVLLRVVWHCEYVPRLYPVTTLARSASIIEAATLHWKEYVMESTELGALMLWTCIWGMLTYSDESPLRSLGLSAVSNSIGCVAQRYSAITNFRLLCSFPEQMRVSRILLHQAGWSQPQRSLRDVRSS